MGKEGSKGIQDSGEVRRGTYAGTERQVVKQRVASLSMKRETGSEMARHQVYEQSVKKDRC